MVKRIYHGSEKIIEKPIYGYGKTYNDYGVGFYCTESLEMAKEWAAGVGRSGYANIYEITMDGLNVLNLEDNKFCILHWLSILLENREFEVTSVLAREAKEYLLENFLPEYTSFDVIIGYRADDSYFSFAQDFLNGTISYQRLSSAMHLGKLGRQIVLKSEKAFSRLTFAGVETATEDWYVKRQLRDRQARAAYFNSRKSKRERGDVYVTQIIDEEMKADDERLR